jgi:cytoskeleton protein RodZ
VYSDFGSILRNARMRQGYDINTVAHRLRIRPDVVHSIEMADFDRMPPRGYARNMISSYARLLGLDPSDITRRYLDELHDYQVGRVAGGNRQGSPDQREHRAGERGRRPSEPERRRREQEARRRNGRGEEAHRAGGRSQFGGYDRNGRNGRPRNGASRGANGPRRETAGRNRSDRSRQGQGAVVGGGLNRGAASASSFVGDLRNRLPFMGVAIAVIVLIIILLVLVFGPKGTDSEEVANLPVTGVESATVSTTDLEDSSSDSASSGSSSSEAEPKSFTFSYEVTDGTSVYIDCTVDGESRVSQQVTGPTKQEFTVSKNVTFTAGSNEGITVRVGDDEVKLKTDSSTGYATYTQKLSSYLKSWRKAHNVDASDSDSSSSSTSDDSSSSAADSSSTTGTSTSTETESSTSVSE